MKLSQTNGTYLYYGYNESQSIEQIAQTGFKYVDISFFSRFVKGSVYFTDEYKKIIEDYREALKRYGVTPVQSHEPTGNSIGDDGGEYYMKKTPRSIEMAAKIGCPSITIHPGCANLRQMTKEEFKEGNVKAIKKLIPYAEEYGIELLLENIGYANTPGCINVHAVTAQDLIDIVDEIDHPLVAVNWDVGHAHFNGLDEYAEMTKLGKRLHGVHVHDNLGFARADGHGSVVEGDMHTLPLFCTVDFDAVIKALIDIDYKGAFNFEVDAPKYVMKYTEGRADLLEAAQNVRRGTDRLLYDIGVLLLKKYGVFEE